MLKKSMRDSMDAIADDLDTQKKHRLIQESKKVFELNNVVIGTIKGANRIFLEKALITASFIFILYLFFRIIGVW